MKLRRQLTGIGIFNILVVLIVSLFSVSVQAAFLYKSYVIRKAGGEDILCDPYLVQKNDYVLKIFRERGEISHADFPEFLKIFKSINPQVQNVDKILPGQQIFLPLKKLEPGNSPGQDFSVVTIPFVTGTEIDDLLKNNADAYEVKPGDTVSKLLSANFGRYGTAAYQEGLSIFKALNPDIEDVNLIVAGQKLLLPQKALQNELWYESLFDSSGNVAQIQPVETPEPAAEAAGDEAESLSPKTEALAPLAKAAGILDAEIYQKGTYYFPRSGRSDLQLDLSKIPVLELKGGGRVLVMSPDSKGKSLSDEELSVLRTFWKDLVVAELPADAAQPQIFDAVMDSLSNSFVQGNRTFMDGEIQVTIQPQWMIEQPKQGRSLAVTTIDGMKEKTPRPVLEYLKKFGVVLKEVVASDLSNDTVSSAGITAYAQIPALDTSSDRRTFVRDFFGILGAAYQQNVTVSFPYAGVQIQAVTDLLSRPDGLSVLVDFGDFQGDAATAIEKTGLKVLQIPLQGNSAGLIPELLAAAGMICEKDPTFTAAQRSGPNNTTIAVPGFLARKDQTPRVLLTAVSVPDDLVRFFSEKNIDVVALTNGANR